ncbi:MAG: hypothetical protein ACHQAX_07025 [Gammaproteobacteria bacterium]
MSKWEKWLKASRNEPMGEGIENTFWRDLLGDTLLEQKEQEFEALKVANTKLATKQDSKDERDTKTRQDDREAALTALNDEKKDYASFSNAVRDAIDENFKIILELDHDALDTDKIDKLKEKFINVYNSALREYAIQTYVYDKSSENLLANFKETREEIESLNKIADKKERAEKLKSINGKLSTKEFKKATLKSLRGDITTDAIDYTDGIDYKAMFFELKKDAYKLKNVANEDLLEKIKKEQEEKLRAVKHKWWAVWVGLKNAKYFALSCGTTMGGALLMIASALGAEGPILLAATVASLPIVYWVTRANWWLTNKAVPKLALDLAEPIEFLKDFWKKLCKNPKTTIYNLIVSFVITVVWAGLTYDTTLELTKQLYDKSTMSGSLASMIVLGVTSVMAVVAARKLYKSYIKNNKLSGLKTVWAAAIIAVTAAIAYWVLGANSVAFQQASIFAATIMMTFYTAPAIYTVFNKYTDGFIKAFQGPIDEEGNDNAYYHKNIDKSFDDIITEARNNKNALEKFNTTYKVIMGFGILLAIVSTLVLQQVIMGENISFTTLPDFKSMEFWGSVIGSAGVVGIAVKGIFMGIDWKTNSSVSDQNDKGINKGMLYKALVVLGSAALIGAFGQVIASNHILGNIFTKWMGATDSQVTILNAVFTMGVGFLGAAGFYFGASIGAVQQLFGVQKPNLDLADPTGRKRQPDVTETINKNKSWMSQKITWAADTANLFGIKPTPEQFKREVILNGVGNCLPPIYAAGANPVQAIGLGFASCAGSIACNIDAKDPAPHPLPNVKPQEATVAMLTYLRRKEEAAKKPSAGLSARRGME